MGIPLKVRQPVKLTNHTFLHSLQIANDCSDDARIKFIALQPIITQFLDPPTSMIFSQLIKSISYEFCHVLPVNIFLPNQLEAVLKFSITELYIFRTSLTIFSWLCLARALNLAFIPRFEAYSLLLINSTIAPARAYGSPS